MEILRNIRSIFGEAVAYLWDLDDAFGLYEIIYNASLLWVLIFCARPDKDPRNMLPLTLGPRSTGILKYSY